MKLWAVGMLWLYLRPAIVFPRHFHLDFQLAIQFSSKRNIYYILLLAISISFGLLLFSNAFSYTRQVRAGRRGQSLLWKSCTVCGH